MGIKGQDPE